MTKKNKNTKKKKNTKLSLPKVNILIVGVGGGGTSIVKEMAEKMDTRRMLRFKPHFLVVDSDFRSFNNLPQGVKKFELHLDLPSLKKIKDNKKDRQFLNFRESWEGKGTGMNPALGERMAQFSKNSFREKILKYNVVILVGCLGGGVGSGALPVFAETLASGRSFFKVGNSSRASLEGLKKTQRYLSHPPLTLGILTLPFEFEGAKKMNVAEQGLQKARSYLSGYVVVANDRIFDLCEKTTPLRQALSLLNQVLIDYLTDLVEVLSKTGFINIDFADLRTILKGRGHQIYLGRGEASGDNRSEKVIEQIFSNPLFEMPRKIKRILFNVSGGNDLSLQEVDEVSSKIAELNRKAKIIFGISEERKDKGRMKVVLLAVGSKKETPFKSLKKLKNKKKVNTTEKTKKSKSQTKKVKQKKSSQKIDQREFLEKMRPLPTTEISRDYSKDSDFSFSPEEKEKREEEQPRLVRRNGLDVQREKQKAQDERRAKETEWEIPAFMKEE